MEASLREVCFMRWILALLAVLATIFVIMPVHYHRFGRISRFWVQVTKVLPTLICAAFAGAALLCGGGRYALLVFIGLCICAAADVMLGVRFVVGGALFLTGHLFYMAAFCTQQTPGWYCLPVFGVMLALLWLFLSRFRSRIQPPILYRGVQLYGAALAALLAFSLPLPFVAFSARTLLAALGAVIFVLSDLGVCHGMLCKISRKRDFCYLGIYYLAQLLLGLSAF